MIEVPGARFSDDRRYRYLLTRRVGTGKKRVMFLMLNPSTADEVRNDPTIARCIGFASSWDCGWLYVTNLSPLRATDPADVLRVGPEPDDVWDTNVENILETAMCCDFTVAAWGNHGAAEGRADRVLAQLGANGKKVLCLGVTQQGYPRHPLYVPADTRPVPYSSTNC